MSKKILLASILSGMGLFFVETKFGFLSPKVLKVNEARPSPTISAKKTHFSPNGGQTDGSDLIPFEVKIDGKVKFGYRTKFGKVIIPPKFYSAHYFQDGYAEVAIKSQETGKYYKYMHQYGFYDGDDLAIIDIFGEVILKGKDNEQFSCHSDGLLNKTALPLKALPGFYKDIEASEQVIKIKTGEMFSIPPETTLLRCFKENLAVAGVGVIPIGESSHSAKKFGYIGKNGEWKIEPIFDAAQNFDNGLALVEKDGKKFFINAEGEKIIDNSKRFKPKLELSSDEYGKMRVVDRSGKTVSYLRKTLRSSFDSFTDGLLLVRDETSSRYGYINSIGELVVATKFKEARPFKNGVAAVITNRDRDAYIDTTGKILWEDIKTRKEPSPKVDQP